MADDRWREDDSRRDWPEDRSRHGGERRFGDRGRSSYDGSYGGDRQGRGYSRERAGYDPSEGRRPEEGSAYARRYGYSPDDTLGRARPYGSLHNEGFSGSGYERSVRGDRRPPYGPGYRDEDRDNERSWWDRTKDEVKSWGGDDDARRRREMDEIENNRGRGPRGYTRSDERIREDVSDRLSDDWRVDASDIEVSVTGGEVTLGGTVRSRDDKRRAEDLADDCSGVKHVQNNLRINDSRTPGATSAMAAPETVRDVTDGR
ncbi:BON domain-containing protein [Brevundimonas diminuta]|uniref:BON domain-containing protein n=1 Tax=Brevundimonas diminuta TaxID=293 RepID=UPI0030F7D14F